MRDASRSPAPEGPARPGGFTRAEVVSVGTELLLGQIVDTNASYICSVLADLGIGVYFRSTVGDNTGRVQEVFLHALSRADLILSTGGLGPTDDDLTVAAAAGALGLPLERHAEAWAHVQEFFRKRNRPLSSQQEKQAMLPRGARMIPNPRGSAPGVIIEHQEKTLIFTPGVPREMKGMIQDTVVPYSPPAARRRRSSRSSPARRPRSGSAWARRCTGPVRPRWRTPSLRP